MSLWLFPRSTPFISLYPKPSDILLFLARFAFAEHGFLTFYPTCTSLGGITLLILKILVK